MQRARQMQSVIPCYAIHVKAITSKDREYALRQRLSAIHPSVAKFVISY